MSWEEGAESWTPSFAEEYSVFNATPGRLIQRTFESHGSPFVQQYTGRGDTETGYGTYDGELSPQLPPQRHSSPGTKRAITKTPKRPRKREEESFSGQTVTPPQSSNGSRKLAPKTAGDMRSGIQGTMAPHSQQANLAIFANSSVDPYGYPMSAPATAPAFWDGDTSMGGMQLDFSTAETNLFTHAHQISTPFDWGKSNQILQETASIPQIDGVRDRPRRQRALTKKPMRPTELPTTQAAFALSRADNSDVFTSDGVDPGLLYSRHNSISTAASEFGDVALLAPRPASSHITGEPYQHQLRESRRDREELRRSRSGRESRGESNFQRATVSSPVKGSARPGLQRAVSDSRGYRFQDQLSHSRRTSPTKIQRTLTSIPESPFARPKTEVRLTIDGNGRARAETITVNPPSPQRRLSAPSQDWQSSGDESSSDDEPIVVPSRNNSFALPVQRPHSRSLSNNRRNSTSNAADGDSDAETILESSESVSPTGNATTALRALMETRKQQPGLYNPRLQSHNYNTRHHLYPSYDEYEHSVSPMTDSSNRSGVTRCVCGKEEGDEREEGLMIQCENCENWLHAGCVGVQRRNLPKVYICAFCAGTPRVARARGGKERGVSPLARKGRDKREANAKGKGRRIGV